MAVRRDRSTLYMVLSFSALLIVFPLVIYSTTGKTINFGGQPNTGQIKITGVATLPANTKLANAGWDGDTFRYQTRPMNKGEVPEIYIFRKISGINGENEEIVILHEPK
jgi:hypothetical protein